MLSWFGREDTVECVRSLLAHPMPAIVLVVDNGSFDGVIEEVAERWPSVATLQTDANLGFAGGMNRGIQWALDRGYGFVTVLNNDTVVPAGTIAHLQQLVSGASLAVSPEVHYQDHPEDIWFGGATFDTTLNFPFHTPSDQLEPARGGLRMTPLLAGCCITAPAAVWREVGLFDERFYLNFEDSEWSLRAHAHGVALAVDCQTRILHAVSASFARDAAILGTFYFVRNGLLFNRLSGGSLFSRVLFVRRKALLAVTASARAGEWNTAYRHGIVVGWAIACHAIGRYGEAPMRLQKLVSGWRV